MKPSVAPDTGQIIETTTRKRVLTAAESPETKTPELWEYLEEVERKGEWGNHIIYIYREDPGPSVPVQKCQRHLVTPTGEQVPIFDQQEVEFAFLKHYGGRVFRFMVKRGAQLISKGIITIDAPPRLIQAAPYANAPNSGGMGPTLVSPLPPGSDPTAVVASRAFDALGTQERTAAEIGFAAMRTGLDAVTRAVDIQRNAQPTQQDPMMQQIMVALATRLAQDPMQQFVQLITLLKELNTLTGGTSGGMDPRVSKILDTALDRMMNPQPAAAPVSPFAEAVRHAPQILAQVTEAVREQRLLSENQVRLAQMSNMHSGPQQVLPAAPPAQPPAPPANGAPTLEFIEQRIVQIMAAPVSAKQAADDALTFLNGLDPSGNSVTQLTGLGEDGLLKFFASRPMLKPATGNMPRLVEFIREFLKMHADDVALASREKGPLQN